MSVKEAEVLVEVWAKGEPTSEQLINNEPLKEFRQRLQAAIRKVRPKYKLVLLVSEHQCSLAISQATTARVLSFVFRSATQQMDLSSLL